MHIKNSGEPSILLMYSPQRFDRRFGAVKPEGSLGLIYLAGALRSNDYSVKVLDCSVGNDDHSLEETFFRQTPLGNGMTRVGLSIEEIIRQSRDFDVIGISSIFTAQTSMVREVVSSIRQAYPEKLILIGGVNARAQKELFLNNGADIVFLGESERTILEICSLLRQGMRDFSSVSGIAFMLDGGVRVNPSVYVETNLDNLPFPAWDMMPLSKYWQIARPYGGGFSADHPVAYAPAMTSRGCPFECDFCHIKLEKSGSESGNLRQLRLKSIERVVQEIEILKSLGVEHVFLEDDSLLGRKNRASSIFRRIIDLKVKLSGVNGINIAHLCTSKDGVQGAVDDEIMETMAEAGFQKFMLPVESGSQRIIDKYATKKLNLSVHDIPGLIRKAKSLGMHIGGNYTFGYPDETEEEMMLTFKLAKRHMADGLDNANFMLITPFPGTEFYERSRRENLLLPEIEVEDYDWMRPVIRTLIPHKKLMGMMVSGWEEINRPERIARIRSLSPDHLAK